MLAALDRVADELADGSVRLRRHRRGHPHGHRAPGHRAGRLRRGPSSTPAAVATTKWSPRCASSPSASSPTSPAGVLALQHVLLDRAGDAGHAYLPGYTHLQRAQPVLLSHHLLAHGWALARDVDRLLDTRHRLDVSPLGAGALAGSSLPLDPHGVAADLGFAASFENSLDAVSDRDFVAESLFDLALLGIHLSRIGEEIVLWSSDEFGFLHLDDSFATGSSMMPQKKNPDIAELVRGKAGRLVGHLTGVLTTLKGLPLAYNRDLQEDKEPLFDALDQVRLGLAALRGLLATASFDTDSDASRGRQPLRRRHRPRRVPRREGHAVPRGAHDRRRARARLDRAPRAAGRARRGPPRARSRRGRAARAGRGGHAPELARRWRPRSGHRPDRPVPRRACGRRERRLAGA